MLIALVSAIASAGNVLIDKIVLTKGKVSLRNYVPVIFLFLFIITFVTLPWLGWVNLELATHQTYLFYFILMVLLAQLWNMLYYEGLKKERMIEFESIMLLTPLVTVLMAALFFPEEFNLPTFVAAIVGSVVLILSHLKKHHLDFDKYAIHLVFAVILMALESMVQKELLVVYSPALLYALRTAFLALFFVSYYRPDIHAMKDGFFKLTFVSALCGALFMISRFYGYQLIGVTMTTLVLLLVPVVVTWMDARIFGTPIRWRTVLAFIIILLCVIYATVQQGL